MPETRVVLEGRQLRLKPEDSGLDINLLRAQIDEGLSQITRIVIEFLCPDIDLDFGRIVGKTMLVEMDAADDNDRYFHGHCVECEYLGLYQGRGVFRAEVRPWLWFLTRTTDCRIFQQMSAQTIIETVFRDAGFSDFRSALSETYVERPYCVQYRESDFDFVSRLMEQEGIYYFFEHTADGHTLVMADGSGGHSAVTDAAEIEFFFREPTYRRKEDHIFEWQGREGVRPGKVSLTDYEFALPGTDLMSVSMIEKGSHGHKSYELYDYPGRHRDTERGGHLARVRMEAEAAEHQRKRGVGNVRHLAVGATFTLASHPRDSENVEYLIVRARHQLQIESDEEDDDELDAVLGGFLDFNKKNNPDTYRCIFEVQPLAEPFRAPQTTPWPRIAGIQTAVVVGPDGDEIHTDAYGRVKVQFHWDREGKEEDRKENSSCWVRKAEPWSGAQWGMQWIPRIGQEVVVMFEEGDPDRPLIVGMLFNGANAHPGFRQEDLSAATTTSTDEEGRSFSSPLPANFNLMGWTTRSTKTGSATTFHELVFDDTKLAEFVRFQSERNYKQIIKNNAEISIGVEHADPGDLTHTVQNDVTESIGNDESVTIGNNRTLNVGNDHAVDVGNNETVTIATDKTDDVGSNYTVTVGSNLEITANSKIVLTCGGSKIEMTPSKVSISSPTIELSADGKIELVSSGSSKLQGGGMTEVKAGGVLIVKGATTMIN